MGNEETGQIISKRIHFLYLYFQFYFVILFEIYKSMRKKRKTTCIFSLRSNLKIFEMCIKPYRSMSLKIFISFENSRILDLLSIKINYYKNEVT